MSNSFAIQPLSVCKIRSTLVFSALLLAVGLAAQPTITHTTSPFFDLDSNKPGVDGPTAAYVGFEISNGTLNDYTGVTATITVAGAGFSLAGGQVATQEVGTGGKLDDGVSETLYWFVQYPATFDETVTLTVELSDINGILATQTAMVTTRSSISANAGGLIASTTLGPGVFVGQIVYFDVNYIFGNIKKDDYVNMQPAGNPNFNASCYQLIDAEILYSEIPGINAGDRDQLYYLASANQTGSSIAVNVRYYFYVNFHGVGATNALPYAATLSGNQYKYSGNYGLQTANLPNPEPSIALSKSVTPDNINIPPGFVTYTLTVSNTSTVDVSFQKITDMLPLPLNFEAIDVTSQITAANSSSIPAMNATGTLLFISNDVPADANVNAEYFIPIGGTLKLVYIAEVPFGTSDGSYTNCATATTGNYTTPQAKAVVTVGCDNPCLITGPSIVCENTMNHMYSAPAGQTMYTWTITGNGMITTDPSLQQVTVSAGVAGTYTLHLTIKDATNCETMCEQEVTVEANPVCSITGDDPVCAGSMNNIYSGPAGMASYQWSLLSGDGMIVGSTTGQTVNFTAGPVGPSTLQLVVENASGCTSTCTKVITNGAAAVMANITPDPLQFCTGDLTPVVMNGNPTGGAQPYVHSWTGGGSVYLNFTDIANPEFTNPGVAATYHIVYTVTDANGCTAMDEMDIVVVEDPMLTLTTSGPATAICGETVSYTIAVSNIFEDITNFQFSVNWDETQMQYIAPPTALAIGGDAPAINDGNASMGELTYSWVDLSAPFGENLADNTTILTLNMKVLASSGNFAITLTDTPTPGEVANTDFCTAAPTYDNAASTAFSPITITLGAIAPVCPGTPSVTLSYSATTGSPDTYSIDFNAAAEAQGFVDVVDAMLPPSPITINVPANATCGSYNATFTLKKSGTACINTYNISVVLEDLLDPILSCPADLTLECNSLTNYTALIEDWLLDFTATDNCGGGVTITDDYAGGVPTLSCDLSSGLTVTVTAEDGCGNTATCMRTVYLDDTVAPTITCTANTIITCPATPSFLTPTYSDACDMNPVLTFVDVTTPGACAEAYSVTRTWTITDDCGNAATCMQTITVSVPNLTVTCPADPILAACSSNTAIQDAYDAWVAGFSYSGGCNVTTNIAEVPALDMAMIHCGGQLTFTYTATSGSGDCLNGNGTCTATFTVQSAADLVATCPAPVVVPACSSDAAILAAYNTWVAGFGVSGGCSSTSNIGAIPALNSISNCGGVINFTLIADNAAGGCVDHAECSSSFTIGTAADLVATCPAPVVVPACSSDAAILTAYNNWVAGFSVSGGCSPTSNIVFLRYGN